MNDKGNEIVHWPNIYLLTFLQRADYKVSLLQLISN